MGFSGGTVVKNYPANAGGTRDTGSVPGSRRSLGEGNGSPLEYFCLKNPMDRGASWATVHGITESDMTEQLSTHTKYNSIYIICINIIYTYIYLYLYNYTNIYLYGASLVAQRVKNRLQCRRLKFDPWVGKIPWRRE